MLGIQDGASLEQKIMLWVEWKSYTCRKKSGIFLLVIKWYTYYIIIKFSKMDTYLVGNNLIEIFTQFLTIFVFHLLLWKSFDGWIKCQTGRQKKTTDESLVSVIVGKGTDTKI